MITEKFLPDGRQFLWSAHSLESAKTCHRKYYYEQRLVLSTKSENVHAKFGSLVAEANEFYHKRKAEGDSHDDALSAVVRRALEDSWDHDRGQPFLRHEDLRSLGGSAHLKTRENLIRTLVWYFEAYQDDPCRTVLLANDTAAVELDFQFDLAHEMVLRGRLDRLVEYGGNVYVEDTKTTGSMLGSYYFKRYNPDNQMSLYSVAAQVVFQSPVKGVIINAMQIAVGFSRFERGFTYRTTEQNEEWLRDARYAIEDTWAAEARGWPMNDTACQKYGGCSFIDICAKSPQVREDFLAVGFVKREEG